MTWDLMYLVDDEWKFDSEHPDAQSAICTVTLTTGQAVMSDADENGTRAIRTLDGELVACARQHIEHPLTTPGGEVQGTPGPLRRFLGLTWIGWLNYLLLRWFLFRIYYMVETTGEISRYGVKFVPSWRW